MVDNAALFGKGHEFATNLYMLSWDTRFRRTAFLTSKIAGWALAFHTGKVASTADGGTPAGISHLFEYQDHTGTGYYGSGRQLPVFTIVERATSGLLRQFPSLIISALELSGNMNDFCRIGLDMVGSGKMTRLSGTASFGSGTIGAGANGVVTFTDDVSGVSTKTVTVVAGVGNNVALSVAGTTAITITLGTDGGGALDATKNTATLVRAALDAVAGISAVHSGTGATVIPVTASQPFAGGGSTYTFPTGTAGEEGERLRNSAMLFEVGETGDLEDVSCDIRSWRFRSEYALAEEDGYCPGSGYLVDGDPTSGQIRNKLEFLRRSVMLEFVVRASSSNTLFAQMEGQTELAAQITLTGPAINAVPSNHSLVINVPRLRYRAVAIGSDGDLVTYAVTTVVMYDSTLLNPFDITVVNTTPAYLVASV